MPCNFLIHWKKAWFIISVYYCKLYSKICALIDSRRRKEHWAQRSFDPCLPFHKGERPESSGTYGVLDKMINSIWYCLIVWPSYCFVTMRSLEDTRAVSFAVIRYLIVRLFLKQQVQNFGDPFFLVIHEAEKIEDVKLRIQRRLQVPDEEFSKVCNLCSILLLELQISLLSNYIC